MMAAKGLFLSRYFFLYDLRYARLYVYVMPGCPYVMPGFSSVMPGSLSVMPGF